MQFFNKLDLYWFILSFTIGMYIVYVFGPKPSVLYKYPSPDENTTYSDLANNCYKFISEKTKCVNSKLIPLQFIYTS
jgi:hypothetical protein